MVVLDLTLLEMIFGQNDMINCCRELNYAYFDTKLDALLARFVTVSEVLNMWRSLSDSGDLTFKVYRV